MLETAFGGRIYRIPQPVIAQMERHPILHSLMLTRMGYFIDAASHVAERDTIDEYIIMYCVEGQGRLELAGTSWSVNAGEVAVVFKHMAHRYASDAETPWSIFWAHLNGEQVEHYLKLALISVDQPVKKLREPNKLAHMFTEISAILQMGYSLHHLVRSSDHLRQILSYIAFREFSSESVSAFDIEAIINYMVQNLTESVSLQTLADQLSLSPSYFSRVFHKTTGYAPIDYFIRLKMQKACELLELTNMTIGEISEYLGYSTPYYFSRLFKKIVGKSPLHHRQSI